MKDAPGLSFELASVLLGEYQETYYPAIQLDTFGGKNSPSVELHGPYGLYSLPLSPALDGNGNVTQACKALVGSEGDRKHAWLCEDPRVTATLPALNAGESIFYGAWCNWIRNNADGSVLMVTTTDGQTSGPQVSRAVSTSAITDSSPWGSITLNQSGYVVKVTSIQLGPGPDYQAIALAPPLTSLFSALDTLFAMLTTVLAQPAVVGKPLDTAGSWAEGLAQYEAAKATLIQQMASTSTQSM